MPETGLAEPPELAVLVHFPVAPPVSTLHRLSEHATSWWYSSSDPAALTGGRFDLEAPHGTCYTAESLDGALVEKLLRTGTKVVAEERLGELFHAVIDVRRNPAVANLAAAKATGFGVNNEIHTSLDYRMPRRWAMALRRAGWRGLRHLLRGDPSGSTAGPPCSARPVCTPRPLGCGLVFDSSIEAKLSNFFVRSTLMSKCAPSRPRCH